MSSAAPAIAQGTPMAPKISVLLSSYNHEAFVQEAIDRVLQQSFGDFELIILDDASSDRSWEVISRNDDPRIRAYRNASRIGAVNFENPTASSASACASVRRTVHRSWKSKR